MSAASYSQVMGANDKVRAGLIGAGGRGAYLRGKFQEQSVEVAAVCDVYAARVDTAIGKAPGAKGYSDHRKLVEQKDLDIVVNATPDHWHAVTTIDALNAGKDVYVEKPLTLRIEEGPEIVKAARVNGRVCQVGMQRRSGPHYHEVRDEIVRTGRLGTVTLVRTWWHGNGAHLRKAPPAVQTKPSNLDWARYLGPVKWRDYDPQQYWNFRAYLEFGGGQITDLFTHWIDAVHLLLDQDDPVAAVSSGGVYHFKDGRTAPDTICTLLEYKKGWTATFEGTLAPSMKGTGAEVIGTEGRLECLYNEITFHPVAKGSKPVVFKTDKDNVSEHVKNFLDCVRSRERPNGDVWVGHRSAQASHLGNIAYVEKRRLKFDPVREEILPL
ncbi:MAG: Gfo/Idh/MocA family oxidoreductase [bacterium]|nr:Gfo/Idh/MocA family oxidoreductase [bacterium]